MSGTYYLHVYLKSVYGKVTTETYGPFYFDKGNQSLETTVFERGICDNSNAVALMKNLTEGVVVQNVWIYVMRMSDYTCVHQFLIEDGIVTKKSFSDLDAMQNEILVDRIEIQHRGMKAEYKQ